MFTGIVTHVSEVTAHQQTADGLTLTFKKPKDWDDLAVGESIATNGVCLTVSALSHDTYQCDLMPETLKVTSFGSVVPARVNLERALKIGDRLDGHMAQGHVDDMMKVLSVDQSNGYVVTFELPEPFRDNIVYKGTVIIDGVALTVSKRAENSFSVSLIPYTLVHTTLGDLKKGDIVNLELDIIGKYVIAAMKEKK